jgi:hypothetical protein
MPEGLFQQYIILQKYAAAALTSREVFEELTPYLGEIDDIDSMKLESATVTLTKIIGTNFYVVPVRI